MTQVRVRAGRVSRRAWRQLAAPVTVTVAEWSGWAREAGRVPEAGIDVGEPDPGHLVCAGAAGCVLAVGMIDNRGYVYCGPHGLTFRGDRPVRALTRAELATLRAGGVIDYAGAKRPAARQLVPDAEWSEHCAAVEAAGVPCSDCCGAPGRWRGPADGLRLYVCDGCARARGLEE